MKKSFGSFIFGVVLLAGIFAAILFLKGNEVKKEKTLLGDSVKPPLFLEERRRAEVFGVQKKEETANIVFVGDIMLSRTVDAKMREYNNYFYPFRETTDFLKSADIAFGNLETTITPGRPVKQGEMLFRAEPAVAASLKEAGFDVLSLANNHTLNFGKKGLTDTFKYLAEEKIDWVGAGNNFDEARISVIKEVRGIKVGFLAYTYPAEYQYNFAKEEPQLSFLIKENMESDVAALRTRVDFLIISIHAGTEYAGTAHSSQTEFARAAIDMGADLVVGHHPHVVQNAEIYKGKYIFYSLGNFIFDQMWSEETREGLALKAVISKNGLIDISFYPVKIYDYSQPKILIGEDGKYILDRLNLDLEEKKTIHFDQDFEEDVFYGISQEKEALYLEVEKELEEDLNKDGKLEKISLLKAKTSVFESNEKIWETPENFWIDDFSIGDFTNDGQEDLVLSLWKSGNFGPSMPFWVKENDKSVKNHLFIYNLNDRELELIWGSSNLPRPIKKMAILDLDADNKNELLVLEGDYENLEASANTFSIYTWQGFNIFQEKNFGEGNTSDFSIEKIGDKKYVILY